MRPHSWESSSTLSRSRNTMGICMKRLVLVSLFLFLLPATLLAADSLESGWANPPREARLRAYWWWLNGCVTKEAITRDLEEMKAKGFGGALICDADGSSQDGNDRAPHGPTFLSPEWRELYQHALREADRLGLEMSLNIQSGWNLGGPHGHGGRRGQEAGLVGDACHRPGEDWSRSCPSRPAATVTIATRSSWRIRLKPVDERTAPAPSHAPRRSGTGSRRRATSRCISPRRTRRRCWKRTLPHRARKTRWPPTWSI